MFKEVARLAGLSESIGPNRWRTCRGRNQLVFEYGRGARFRILPPVVIKVRLKPQRNTMHNDQYLLATKESPAQARGDGLPRRV